MQELFLELVQLSLTGSLFVLAVMLVRIIFRKAPKWLFCLLWGVVALRLICPISVESELSLVPDRLASGQIISNVGSDYVGEVNIIYENNAGYSNAVEAGRQPIYSDSGYYVVTEKDSYDAPATVEETVYPVLSWIWLVGMALMLTYTAVSYLALKRKMEEATLLRDNIWQCEQVESPFVLGIIKPRIYLPYQISDSDMDNVIAHELAHIHRKDHWWKPIGFLLLSVHWFNPVMWVAYILLCRDIEAACDEKVIKHMEKDEMRAYSTALLHCSVHRRRIAACPLAFGEVGVKERIKRVMNYKKPAFWIIILAITASIIAGIFLLTDPIRTVDGVKFTFKADDIQNIEMYHFEGIPTSAEKKTITDEANIQYLYQLFNGLTLQVKETEDMLSASVTSFRFNLADGSCYELIYCGYGVKNGELKSPTGNFEYFTTADIGWCWTMLNSELEAVPAKERELPGFVTITNLDIITPVEDKPQMSFAGLEVNDVLVDEEFVVVLESGASLDYNITYASQAIKLEFGLLALNGAEISHYIEHGSSQGTLENIPAGLYHLFVRNVGYVNDLPGEAVEGGAVVCEIRNADKIISANLSVLNATVLEIGNGRILVEPLDGSWELNSASKIEIPMKNMDPALEPQVGDVIEITYNGEIQETYPARIDEVFRIRVISERPYITEALTLNEVADLVKQQHTVSFVGMTREAVHGYWGEPDSEVHGFFGDIYHVPDSSESVIFCYDEHGIVERVTVEYRNDSEDWGLTLRLQFESETEFDIVISHSSANQTIEGTISASPEYEIRAIHDGEIISYGSYMRDVLGYDYADTLVGWDTVLYSVEPNGKLIIDCNISTIYGSLPAGEYVIYKPIQLTTSAGQTIVKEYAVKFTIVSSHTNLHIPLKDEIMENGYPKNELGETYGPDIKESEVVPDLILVQNELGVLGYIRATELEGNLPTTSNDTENYEPIRTVKMYLEDGITVVGEFRVS